MRPTDGWGMVGGAAAFFSAEGRDLSSVTIPLTGDLEHGDPEAGEPEAGEPGSCCLTRPSPFTSRWLEMSLTEAMVAWPDPVQHLERDKGKSVLFGPKEVS